MHADAAAIAAASPSKTGKLRLRTLRDLDHRTAAAKRAASLASAFESELGELTPAQRIRVETAAMLSAIAEDAQARRLAGDPTVNLDDLVRAVSAARRAVRDLGFRPNKPSVPTLAEHLAHRAVQRASERSGGAE